MDDEISASVNLMISDPVANNSAQFEFDLDKMEISNVINTAHTARKALFRMVKHLGDERSLDLLHRIGDKHSDPRVRAFAFDAALGIRDDPALLERINYSKDEVFRREFLELR